MSIGKKSKYLILMLTLFTFFIFGCKENNVAVNNISINLGEQSQITLLVDEFFNFDNKIEVSPNYATDKTFSILSMDENVVRVVGHQIKAVAEGETIVRVVSNSNQSVEDVVKVSVYRTQTKLQTPTNLKYNEAEQTFSFNPVDYAASYSININNREFNIGNVNSFELSNYVGEKYNNVLAVKVKANAPTYSQAYVQSEYSDYIKVFQTSKADDVKILNGKLLFNVNADIVYDVYVEDELFAENLNVGEVNFLTLDNTYAGSNNKVYVISKPSETIKATLDFDVSCFSSKSEVVTLNVLDEPEINLLDDMVYWEAIAFANEYAVYINGIKEAVVQTSSYSLKNSPYYNNLLTGETLQISVLAELPASSSGLGKTNKQNFIELTRLAQPVVSVTDNGISWTAVANASIYAVEVKRDTLPVLSINTDKTLFDLSNMDAGEYEISVCAIGNNEHNNYLTSKASVVNLTKRQAVTASISDYVLNIETQTNEKYFVSFDIDGTNSYESTIVASGNLSSVDLSSYNFSAGNHTINILQFGDSNTYINSKISEVEFTQLESVNVNIASSVASVVKSTTNQYANIYLEISGGTLTTPIKVNADSYTINTTNPATNCLGAGEYCVVAYVYGDGSSTFSFGINKNAVACGEKTFKVLNVPSLAILDNSVAELTINKVSDAVNYNIYDENNMLITAVSDKYSFSLASGEMKNFKVCANGNGCDVLTSASSSLISVKRLISPELSFDANSLSFDITTNNSTSNYSSVALYYDELLVPSYSFNTAFSGLNVGVNNFKAKLISAGVVDGVVYLDSLYDQIVVKKLNNSLTASINEDNKLVVSNPENAQLMLKYDFDANEYLAESGLISGLSYVQASNSYIITLLDSNYKAIIPNMVNEFEIKAKFVKDTIENGTIRTYYANGDWSTGVKLKLNTLVSADQIYSNTDNKLIITNPNSERLYLDLYLQVGASVLEFKDNGRYQLEHSGTTISYSYSSGKYIVDLYNNGNIIIDEIDAGSNFIVKAKLKKTVSNSDIDSAISSAVNVNYLQTIKFERDEQKLKFTSIKEGYGLDKYKLIINGTNKYSLNDFSSVFVVDTTSSLTTYSAEITALWNAIKTKMPSFDKTLVNYFEIETLNTATTTSDVLLGSKGDAVYNQQAQCFTIESLKKDSNTIVKINKETTKYSKVYAVNVLGYQDYSADDSNPINITLDTLTFSGNLSVSGYVKANSSYTDSGRLINVFNSEQSNILTFKRLEKPVLTVANNEITYTTIAGANSYEIYKLSSASVFEKVDETNITRNGNSFRLNNLIGYSETTIAVKAVTSNSLILNSNLSDSLVVVKLAQPSVYIENGVIKLALPTSCKALISSGDITASLALNLSGNLYECTIDSGFGTSVAGIEWNSSQEKFIINSGLVFNYLDDYIQNKTISVTLKLDGSKDSKHYIYSDLYQNTEIKGLFAPADIEVNKGSGSIDNLTWSNNPKNKLSSTGSLVNINQYVMAVSYGAETYYSTDAKLKFSNGSVYSSYGSITTTDIAFPYGYDANNDGDFDDADDVIFNSGAFTIYIACVSDGYASSPYAQYMFGILEQAEVKIEKGILVWDDVQYADSYILTITNGSNKFTKEVAKTSRKFDFTEYDKEGICSATVQAITTDVNRLNSKESEPIQFYKLEQVDTNNVKINNGVLEVKASPFVSAIRVMYNGITMEAVNAKQAENFNTLNFFSASDVLYYIDSTNEMSGFAGSNQRIKIQLCGNTGVFSTAMGEYGLVNSKITENEVSTAVLSSNTYEVKTGVWVFKQNNSLGKADDSPVEINYNFDDCNSGMHEFWKTAILYQIQVNAYSQGINETHIIYAVDYYRFKYAVDNGSLLTDTTKQSYYELCNNRNDLYAKIVYKTQTGDSIYFNVYKDNTIDLQTYDSLWYYAVECDYASYKTSVTDVQAVDLAKGGSFAVKIRTIGGDQTTSSSYLNSYEEKLNVFVRFEQSVLSTKSGQLKFKSLKQDGCVSPVYELIINPLNQATEYKVYLYDQAECSEDDVKIKFGSSDFYDPIEIERDSTTGIDYVLYDIGKHFGGGVYTVKIRALAGVGADDYLLHAKQPSTQYQFKVLSSITPTVDSGDIIFDLAWVSGDNSEKEYSDTYEVVIKEGVSGTEYKCEITGTSEGVMIDDNSLRYTIPNAIGGLNIVNGKTYYLKIRAITERDGWINSQFKTSAGTTSDFYLELTREDAVSNVRIDSGVLQWTGEETATYIIKLSYNDGADKAILINTSVYGATHTGTAWQYVFADGLYKVYGLNTNAYIDNGIDYKIGVSKMGNSDKKISSVYTYVDAVERLKRVEESTIKAGSGLLTWETIADAVGYKIQFIGTSTYTYTLTTNINRLDLSNTNYDGSTSLLPKGEYDVMVTAVGNEKITSITTLASRKLTKLAKVTLIEFESNMVTWDAVANANGYKVVFKYKNTAGTDVESAEEVTTNTIAIPTDVSGRLTVEIFALGNDDCLLNGDVETSSTSSETPLGVTGFSFNSTNNRYEWKTQADFESSDKIIITYKLCKRNKNGTLEDEVETTIEITQYQENYYDSASGVYYFDANVIGTYEVSVRIRRAGAIDSAVAELVNSVTINLFKYGSGRSSDPYAINSEEHLLNIKYYPAAYYILLDNISLADRTMAESKPLVDITFSGNIDGGSYTIDLKTITLEKLSTFALFRSLNKAALSNLQIKAKIASVVDVNASEIKLAILAVESTQATIKNVTISESTIEVSGTANGKILYIAGMFASDASSTITNDASAEVNCAITINATTNNRSEVYIGGISGKSDKANIEGYNVKLNVSGTAGMNYLGGISGYYTGTDTKTTGVTNSSIELNYANINMTYSGGVFGYAANALIENNTITGDMSHEAIKFDVYIGGLVGRLLKGRASGNTVSATMEFTIGTKIGTQKLGYYVGLLDKNSELTVKSNLDEKTADLVANNKVILGVYGEKDESANCNITTD